jgi:cysteine desulfurase
MRRIYMDANATTPLLPEVADVMRPWWESSFGNASAVHSFGREARGAIERARDQLARLIGARATEITFTSGGTESDNLALFGLLEAGDHLTVSAIEHDAVLHAADALEARGGVSVSRIACDAQGVVSAEAVKAALRPETRLVSVMVANNETGVLQPMSEIAEVVHAAGALLHTDAIQACGKMPVDVRALGCDLLSVSAHKMYAPQGVGALWVRGGVTLRPMMHGGSHERRRRAGTENVAGIAGLGAAADLASRWMDAGGTDRLCGLRRHFERLLLERIDGISVNGADAERLPNTASVRFSGVEAESLVIALDMQGLAVSGGSACQSGAIEPSHVLRAMGLDDADARSSVRFSLLRTVTAEEVEAAADLVAAAVARLRSV